MVSARGTAARGMVGLGWSALPDLRLGNSDALCGVRAIRVVAHRDLTADCLGGLCGRLADPQSLQCLASHRSDQLNHIGSLTSRCQPVDVCG